MENYSEQQVEQQILEEIKKTQKAVKIIEQSKEAVEKLSELKDELESQIAKMKGMCKELDERIGDIKEELQDLVADKINLVMEDEKQRIEQNLHSVFQEISNQKKSFDELSNRLNKIQLSGITTNQFQELQTQVNINHNILLEDFATLYGKRDEIEKEVLNMNDSFKFTLASILKKNQFVQYLALSALAISLLSLAFCLFS